MELGTRLYAVSEIKEIMKNGADETFLEYVEELPEKVKKIVLSWDPNYKENELLVNDLEGQTENDEEIILEEKEDIIHDKSIPEETNVKIETRMAAVQNNESDNIEEAQESNEEKILKIRELYNQINFMQRMNVPILLMTIMEEASCPIHHIELKKIQVLMPSFGGTKKFSLMINCCPKCKKFYVSKKEYSKKLKILNSKHIEYIVES